MGKRRYNLKQIAKQPLLKKNMAKFCATVDVKYGTEKDLLLETLLYSGNRGFISFSEEELSKEFDKRLEILRFKYSVAKVIEDERIKTKTRYMNYPDERFVYLEMLYQEGVALADQVFEDNFL